MNVKIMLNKDEEIKRLAADPEVELRIKNAIIDGVGKRVAKTLGDEGMERITSECRKVLHEELEKQSFIKHSSDFFRSLQISNELRDAIRQEAQSLLAVAIQNCVNETFNSMGRSTIGMMVAGRIQELNLMDCKKVIADAADRVIRSRLSGGR